MKENFEVIGDILITYLGGEQRPPTRSTNPWRMKSRYGHTRVWMTEPDENWRGFPLTTYLDDRWHIWALGEFYGYPPIFPTALNLPENLNGHFIIFAYDLSEMHWHVFTNRFGTIHAYIADNGKRRAMGTFSPSVADEASRKQLDLNALAGFFTFGFFLDNSTYWQDEEILSPATHFIFDAHGRILSEEITWVWHHDLQPKITNKRVLDQFKDLFENAVQEQTKGKSVAVPVSGGLDSRSTLIPLTRPDFNDTAKLYPFSYGYTKNSAETRIANKLAFQRDLALQTWTIQPYLFDNIKWIISTIEGFHDMTLCRQAYVVKDLAQKTSHVLAAHWGDVWLDDMGFSKESTHLSDDLLARELVRKYTKRGSEQLLCLFRDSLPTDTKAMIESQVANDLRGLKGILDLDFKVKAWKTQSWSFRWTLASLRMYQTSLFPLLPFYDNRLTDLFCSLPSEVVRSRQLQIDYLKTFGPDLARVAWQVFDANLFNYQYYNSWLLPKRAIKKLGNLLTGNKVIQFNWEVQFLNNKGRIGLENWLLTPGLKLHDFAKKSRLETFLKLFYLNPDATNGYAISMLLTFSAWLETYG